MGYEIGINAIWDTAFFLVLFAIGTKGFIVENRYGTRRSGIL